MATHKLFPSTNVFTLPILVSPISSCLSLPWCLYFPQWRETFCHMINYALWWASPQLGEHCHALWWASPHLGGSPTIILYIQFVAMCCHLVIDMRHTITSWQRLVISIGLGVEQDAGITCILKNCYIIFLTTT